MYDLTDVYELLHWIDALERAVETAIERLQGDVSEKDAAFASLKRRQVAKAAAKAGLIGMGIGLVFQEGLALVDEGRVGLVETWLANPSEKADQHETLLKGLFSKNDHFTSTASIENHTEAFNSRGDVTLPKGFELKPNGKNTFDIFNNNGESIATIHTNPDGTFTDETLALLSARGLRVSDATETVTKYIKQRRASSAPKYLRVNEASTVDRDLWYDNNTSGVFDRNELKLWWGGKNNIGADTKGNYLMSVSHMMRNGSFHNGLSADWHAEAAKGRLQLFITISRETQNQGFFIPIDSQGNAVISSDNPAAQLFSRDANGHAIFHGNYVEVTQLTELDANGTQHINMLATHIGERDIRKLTSFERIPVKRTLHHYTIDMRAEDFIEVPPFIPLFGRKALEKLIDRQIPHSPAIEGNYYGGGSLESARQWLAAHPEAHHPYKKLTFEDNTVKWIDADGHEVVRNVDRERSVIKEYLDSISNKQPAYFEYLNEQLNQPGVKPMHQSSRVSVNVPAWMEGKNLYNWLTQYAYQVGAE